MVFRNKNPVDNPDNFLIISDLLSFKRKLVFFCSGLMIVIVFLSIVLLFLFPLKDTKVVLVALDDVDNTVAVIKSIEGKNKDIRASYLMRFAFINYIKSREAISTNSKVNFTNVSSVLRQSTPEVRDLFIEILKSPNYPDKIKSFEREAVSHNQGVLISKENFTKNERIYTRYTFRFNFILQDKNVRIAYFGTPSQVTIDISGYIEEGKIVKLSNLDFNPLGLVVTNYSITYPDSLEKELRELIKKVQAKNSTKGIKQ